MGNNENWVDKLIDELVDAKNLVTNLRVQLSKYEMFIDALLDNSRISSYGGELYYPDVDTLIKAFFEVEYKTRLEHLKFKEEAAAEAALDAENAEG